MSAFTLVELLVVIGVIVVLLSLLGPALQGARQQSQKIVCQIQLKGVFSAMGFYELDNREYPWGFISRIYMRGDPPPGLSGRAVLCDEQYFDRQGWWWFDFLWEYIDYSKPRSILRCPSRNIADPTIKENILLGNYGVNQAVCMSFDELIPEYRIFSDDSPMKTEQIDNPAGALLFVDAGYSLINALNATDAIAQPISNFRQVTSSVPGMWFNGQLRMCSYQYPDAVSGRHPNKTVNVQFADHHVESLPADDLYVESVTGSWKAASPWYMRQ